MKIVYLCDENFVKYLNISIQTLLWHNPKADILVISNKKLDIKYNNLVYVPEKEFISQLRFNENDRITELSYYKLLLPEILLNDEKIIYIDCDTMIQKSLNDIWNMECQYLNVTEHYLPQKYPQNEKHALMGFMLMNLKALREDNFKDKCLQNMDYKQDFWWHEEGLINLNYQDKLKYIDKKYHYCKGRSYKYPIKESEAYILHFPCTTKRFMFQMFSDLREERKRKGLI